jgi:hypothetical protein
MKMNKVNKIEYRFHDYNTYSAYFIISFGDC